MKSASLLATVLLFNPLCVSADGGSRDNASAAGASRSLESGSDVLMPQFRSLDKNGDGFLSKEEASAYPRAKDGAFEQADVDRDGKLDPKEFKVLYANTSEDRRLGSK